MRPITPTALALAVLTPFVSAVVGVPAPVADRLTGAAAPHRTDASAPPSTPAPDDPVAPAIWAPAETTAGAKGVLATVGAASLDIPLAALSAYQRAEAVLGGVDPACGLDWPLLAAVGRVESDHGRHGGSGVDDDGSVSPPIRGVALDGRGPLARIPDTDAGRLDDDPRWDRAVGPMQLLPSTWSIVAVDADADGVRSPHDFDDAALAGGILLCGGSESLTTADGARAALLRYNASEQYVARVLAAAADYRAGGYLLPGVPTYAEQSLPARQVLASAGSAIPDLEVRGPDGPRPGALSSGPDAASTSSEDDDAKQPGGGPKDPPAPTQPPTTGPASGSQGPSSPPVPSDPGPVTPTPAPPTDPTDAPDPTPPEQPTEPTPSAPEPTPDQTAEPAEDPPQEPTPEAGPAPPDEPIPEPLPDPTREPVTETVTGILAFEDGAWTVAGTGVALAGAALPSVFATDDPDGDGRAETPAQELDGSLGSVVTATVVEQAGAAVVVALARAGEPAR